jgi:alkanesulfonate monooxygenase SsuD/methylene tetrahydromethanopterin reductase-like flavin-dependent oxidoreductase (luciferase family)
MEIGIHLTPFFNPGGRAPEDVVDEAVAVGRHVDRLGFDWVSVPHHWAAHPVVWPQPFPLLSALAMETTSARLMTLVVLVPLLGAVDIAENVATIDHLSRGRMTLGAAIGFREAEFAAVGLTRKDRVPKFVESIDIIKRLWAGEEVTLAGRYARLQGARTALTPRQKPRPPIIVGCQSEGAAARAARIADGIYLGPQVPWKGIRHLVEVYRKARAEAGHADPGIVGAGRVLFVGRDKGDTKRVAQGKLEAVFKQYQSWNMQERTMVPIAVSFDTALDDWAINGSPADCVETLQRAREDYGLTHVGLNVYSLPLDRAGRLEHLELISSEIRRRLA